MQGDHKGAIAEYSKAIELNPKYATAYANRAVSYKANGASVEAEKDLQKAKEFGYRDGQAPEIFMPAPGGKKVESRGGTVG
jgi:Flp pilus assembly protein TadD